MFLKSVQWRLVGIFILLTIFLVIPIGLFLNKRIEDRYYDDAIKRYRGRFPQVDHRLLRYQFDMLIYLNEQRNIITQFYYISTYKSYTIVKEDDIDNIVYSSDIVYNTSTEKFKIEMLRSDNFRKYLQEMRSGKAVHFCMWMAGAILIMPGWCILRTGTLCCISGMTARTGGP